MKELEGDIGGEQVVRRHPEQVMLLETAPEELQDIDEKTQNW